jgi:hypothetical protein
MSGMDARQGGTKLPSNRKFGSRFQELYARHWVVSASNSRAERKQQTKIGWKSRTNSNLLPWDTCPRGHFIVTKTNPCEQYISSNDAETERETLECSLLHQFNEESECESVMDRPNRFKHLKTAHYLNSGGFSKDEPVLMVPKRNEVAAPEGIEEPALLSAHPSGLIYAEKANNGARFDHLFQEHWNVYIAGSYGTESNVRTRKIEPTEEVVDEQSMKRESGKGISKWSKLRSCVKAGVRFQKLLSQHYNPENSEELRVGLKPDKIWNERFRAPSEDADSGEVLKIERNEHADTPEGEHMRLRRFEMKVCESV